MARDHDKEEHHLGHRPFNVLQETEPSKENMGGKRGVSQM